MLLNNYSTRLNLLVDWILEDLPPAATVLDIGASDGRWCPELRRIAEGAGRVVGVDPDAKLLEKNPLLHERHPTPLEEAPLPAESFDCAYAIYVFEHVEDPARFLQAAARALKPGGRLYAITPNGWHYFGLITALTARFGIQERLLRRLLAHADTYHHHAVYRLNTPRQIRRFASAAGFSDPDFRYSERYDEFHWYFPGFTKVLPRMYEGVVGFMGAERMLGNLMVRLTKAGGGEQAR